MMNVGDLVKYYVRYDDYIVKSVEYGVVIKIPKRDERFGPGWCEILNSGEIKKVWKIEVEVIK